MLRENVLQLDVVFPATRLHSWGFVVNANAASRMPLPVVLFTLAYLLPAIAISIATGNSEFVYYSVIMVILIGVVLIVHWQCQLSPGVQWCLAIWGAMHMGGGLIPIPESWPSNGPIHVLYSWWLIPKLLKYDHVVHAFGFGVTTIVCWEGLQAIIRKYDPHLQLRPTLGVLVICAAAAMGFGALNEVLEFVATLVLAKTNIGGYDNTGWDLVSNLGGATLAALLLRFTRSSRPIT